MERPGVVRDGWWGATSTWWEGARLVYQRGLLENLRSKAFKVVTAILLLASVGALAFPQLLGGGKPTYTLATIGKAPTPLVTSLQAASRAGDFTVRFVARADEDAVRAAVRDGDATVGLATGSVYSSARDAGTFPGVVTQTVVTLETRQRLSDAGLTSAQIAALQSIRPPQHVSVAPVADEGRAAVGFGVGVALYMALLLAGTAIATAVALEKTTHISEVLLAMLRPSQVLVGTVLAVGTATLVQLLVLGVPLAVGVRAGVDLRLPTVATTDIVLGLVWFVLGFGLYSFVYAACGALVQKVTEVGTAVMPVSLVMVAGYLLSLLVVLKDPGSPGSVAVSMFPLTAPIGMPMRWAGMDLPVWQLVVAMVLVAVTAVALAALASRIYRRALLVTEHRVRVHDVLGRDALRSPGR
jgi:ABC-2 type transport system permease protein